MRAIVPRRPSFIRESSVMHANEILVSRAPPDTATRDGPHGRNEFTAETACSFSSLRIGSPSAILEGSPRVRLVLLLLLIQGCGARSTLTVDKRSADSSMSIVDESSTTFSAPSDAGILCSFNVGPVASCDAGPKLGPVQQCTGLFSDCAREFPDIADGWGCCIPNPPNHHDNCFYATSRTDNVCQ